MVLAQETPILLLDEPIAFLDIVHQIEMLDLLDDLNAEGNPGDIVTEQLVHDVFGLRALVIEDPVSGTPMIVPAKRRRGFA